MKCRVVRVGSTLRSPVVLVANDAVVDSDTLRHSYSCSGSPDLTRRTARFLT